VGTVSTLKAGDRPLLLVKVEPSYPLVARRAGLSGRLAVRVYLSVVVDFLVR
jgi:outer membrane biosynthesis protein TonB